MGQLTVNDSLRCFLTFHDQLYRAMCCSALIVLHNLRHGLIHDCPTRRRIALDWTFCSPERFCQASSLCVEVDGNHVCGLRQSQETKPKALDRRMNVFGGSSLSSKTVSIFLFFRQKGGPRLTKWLTHNLSARCIIIVNNSV